MVNFGNVITASITPFNENLEIDFKEFEKLLLHLENHSDSILVFGTTGESPTLSLEEKIKISEFAKKTTKLPVIANISSNSTEKSLKELEMLEKTDVDGFLVTTPYYNRPPQDALYDYFSSIASKTSRPIIVYNIPSRTGVDLEVTTIVELSKIKNIIGLKQSHSDITKISEILSLNPSFNIYSGDDILTLPALSLGAKGVVSVCSHIAGNMIKKMVTSFKTNPEESRNIHYSLYKLFKVLFITTNPIPVKYALTLLGFNVNNLRPPLRKASQEEAQKIKEVIESITTKI
ncbi:MAG: 4-hydroxy-tetrahydrodipicolinate synthase [Candidatus Calescibacterium sp.]|nr:4-hydroxy-tetrahydrodipicolinate synthase [Candidatus Calescibacterium sp.]MDW8133252.1 4-hydroxy-tetrahydrodipicolinate synthase [Candidatus Calescibacterium sp.]